MFSTIVIGFDASAQALDALALGRALAREETELVVCCVHPPEIPVDRVDEDSPAAQASLRLNEARDRLGGRARTRFEVRGSFSAAAGLHEEAERSDADLLVVGSSHRGAIGRVLPGSVTRQVLHAAPCPVAVAPAGLRDGTPALRRVGVAFDGAPEAVRALAAGARIAAEHGAQLTLLTVVAPVAVSAGWGGAWVDPGAGEAMREAADEQGRAAIAALDGVRAELEVIDGLPGRELVLASTRLDLLVLGSRGYGPVRRVLLGTVSGHVAEAAACPVLVLTRGADAGDGPG
jgi:nucleotide-binding universal stress UspA family protein